VEVPPTPTLPVDLGASAHDDGMHLSISTHEAASDRPLDVIVVLDISGSMSVRGKIDYAKRATERVATSLAPTDRFGLVTFNDTARTVFELQPVEDIQNLHTTIDSIFEVGASNLHQGLSTTLRAFRDNPGERQRHVVVLSDGSPNVGMTDEGAFQAMASTLAPIATVSTVGLDVQEGADILRDLAARSGGTYTYVERPRDLERVFSVDLDRTNSLVARHLEVHVSEGSPLIPVRRFLIPALAAGDQLDLVVPVMNSGGDIGDTEVWLTGMSPVGDGLQWSDRVVLQDGLVRLRPSRRPEASRP